MSFYGNPQTVDDIPDIMVYGLDFRGPILNMHKVITELGLWDELKKETRYKNANFSDEPYVKKIRSHKLIKEEQHSGWTEAYCMHCMQTIAEDGWEFFVQTIKVV